MKFGKKGGLLCLALNGLEGRFFRQKCGKHDIAAEEKRQGK